MRGYAHGNDRRELRRGDRRSDRPRLGAGRGRREGPGLAGRSEGDGGARARSKRRAVRCESHTDAKVRTVKSIVRFTYGGPTSLTWRQEKGDLKSVEGSWELEELDGDRTRATYNIEVDLDGSGLLIRGPLVDVLRGQLAGARAGELKRAIEAVAPARPRRRMFNARLMSGRCRGLALIGCVAAALATAASASARVLDATSILPPGDSGYVSLPGVASGGGSPHLTTTRRSRSSPLTARTRCWASRGRREHSDGRGDDRPRRLRRAHDHRRHRPAHVVGRGLRDRRGPPLRARDLPARDHGAPGGGAGRELRPDGRRGPPRLLHPGRAQALFDGLPPAFQARYIAYAAGINAWVDHVNGTPTDIPAEYPALGITPTHFTPEDLIAIGSYLARTTPNTDGTDLLDMQAIQAGGPAKWGKILPLRIPGQIATIPARKRPLPVGPGTDAATGARGAGTLVRLRPHLPVPPADNLGTESSAARCRPSPRPR